MIFLIRYDRRWAKLLLCEPYEDARHDEAVENRLEYELEAAKNGLDHEVVLLQAQDEKVLHRTHSRYFGTIESLVSDALRPNGKEESR